MKGGIYIPRKKRLWYPGAIYHVIARGNRKDNIFIDKNDYRQYIRYIKEANEKYPFKLYSYCLMSNHVHLQIATIDDEIWKIMQSMNWNYSKHFNSKYEKVGHLFQDRYHSELIDSESYLLQTSRYIHLNPVKACIVDNPAKYPWSSYGVYMDMYKDNLIHKDDTLVYFQYNRELYRQYVEGEDDEVPGTVPGTT